MLPKGLLTLNSMGRINHELPVALLKVRGGSILKQHWLVAALKLYSKYVAHLLTVMLGHFDN